MADCAEINNKVVKKEFRSTAMTIRLPKAYSTVGYNIEQNKHNNRNNRIKKIYSFVAP